MKINEEQSGDKCDIKYKFGVSHLLSWLHLVFLILFCPGAREREEERRWEKKRGISNKNVLSFDWTQLV